MNILTILKQGVPKRVLLFIAAFVWTFAGSMLLFKGYKMINFGSQLLWFQLMCAVACGIVFYLKLFSKLSLKHTLRILNMKEELPCLFSFFNFRSYLMMLLMISMGITLRTTGWVAPIYLSFLYLMMSVPLLISSIRFYYTGLYYRRFVVVVKQK